MIPPANAESLQLLSSTADVIDRLIDNLDVVRARWVTIADHFRAGRYLEGCEQIEANLKTLREASAISNIANAKMAQIEHADPAMFSAARIAIEEQRLRMDLIHCDAEEIRAMLASHEAFGCGGGLVCRVHRIMADRLRDLEVH